MEQQKRQLRRNQGGTKRPPQETTEASKTAQPKAKYNGKNRRRGNNKSNKPKGKADYVINKLQVRPVNRGRTDIGDWRMQLKIADFVINPSRVGLLDLMEEAMLDSHLTGVVGKRFRMVRNKPLRFQDQKGKHLKHLDELLRSKAYRRIRKHIFNTQLYGISGLEFIPGDKLAFKIIPRKHIKPHLGIISREQIGSDGWSYKDVWNIWVLQSDEDDNNYGLLVKAIPWTLYKRGAVGDFAQYIELFGQPMRVGKYSAYDQNTRDQLEEAMEKAGGSMSIMLPKEAEFDIKDGKSSNGDGKLHETFVKSLCNSELSVLVLGVTETTVSSNSSGYGQSKVHQDQTYEITQDDMDYELENLNDPAFINILRSYGYNIPEGAEVVHVEDADLKWLNDRIQVDEKVGKLIPIEDDYYYETYNIPKPKNYDELKAQKEEERKALRKKMEEEEDDEPEEKEKTKRKPKQKKPKGEDLKEQEQNFLSRIVNSIKTSVTDFFGQAPHAGHLTTNISAYYNSTCPVCGGRQHTPPVNVDEGIFRSIAEDLAHDLYNGIQKDGTIPNELYFATADKLMGAMQKGFGGTSFDFDDTRNELTAFLQHNIYAFSAAKSLTELKHFRALMVKDGQLRDFVDFRNAVTDAGYTFNLNYLNTEWSTAVSTAQTAAEFSRFGENEPIQISTAGDDKVRPEHQVLDGYTALKSDPIWVRLCPPFDWFCRCRLIPGVASKIDASINKSELLKSAKVPKHFQRNPALSKVVFKDDHPYFANHRGKETELTAEQVYNMPSVDKLYDQLDFPQAARLNSKEAAIKWWTDRTGDVRGSFDAKDYSGFTIRFDKTFRKHVFEDNAERRYLTINNVEDIIQNPDEVWSLMERGKLKRFYLKYYDDFPYVVRADNKGDAYTFHPFDNGGAINIKSLEKLRRGILLFRK